MINNLEIFYNNTMNFLDKIREEINNITNIEKVDFLYDIDNNIENGEIKEQGDSKTVVDNFMATVPVPEKPEIPEA